MRIRAAVAADLPQLTAIYNHYILQTPITFDVEPQEAAQRRSWLAGFGTNGAHRLLVAAEADALLGYAYSGPFKARAAYASSVEVSVYCAHQACGRGVGSALYRELFGILAEQPLHRAYAGITLPNAASEALHHRFGFEQVGLFREVGFKFGRYWDVGWYERALGPRGGS